MEPRTIGLFEAKTHLSELVARAEQGHEVVITRHNKPVARLVPLQPAPAFDVEQRRKAIRALQEFGREWRRKHGTVTREEIRQWIREGRDDPADPAPRRSRASKP